MSSEAPNRTGENPLRDSRPAAAVEMAVPGAPAPNIRRWHDAVSGITAYAIAEAVFSILVLGIVFVAR
jgi:hypothetical protein